MIDPPLTLEGWLSVRAALISGNREIHRILLQKGKRSSRLEELERRAKEQGVRLEVVSENVLTEHTEGQTHGGVVALVGPRRFVPLADLGRGPQPAFLAMLDGVEDPYNFGQAVRALQAAGAHGLVLRPRNWTSVAATVARASAGASEFMPMAVVETDAELIDGLKKRSIWLVCTDVGKETTSLYEANLAKALCVVIGGERRGVSRDLLAAADLTLTIPYGRNFKQALGTTSATAVVAFEVLRQRSGASSKRGDKQHVEQNKPQSNLKIVKKKV